MELISAMIGKLAPCLELSEDIPEYQGCAVVVGARPDNRGEIAAAFYEAKKFGIHSTMTISEAYP